MIGYPDLYLIARFKTGPFQPAAAYIQPRDFLKAGVGSLPRPVLALQFDPADGMRSVHKKRFLINMWNKCSTSYAFNKLILVSFDNFVWLILYRYAQNTYQ